MQLQPRYVNPGDRLLCLQREIRLQLAEKAKSGDLKAVNGSAASQAAAKRKRRWDQTADQTPSNATPKKLSSWDQADAGAEVSHHDQSVHPAPLEGKKWLF